MDKWSIFSIENMNYGQFSALNFDFGPSFRRGHFSLLHRHLFEGEFDLSCRNKTFTFSAVRHVCQLADAEDSAD